MNNVIVGLDSGYGYGIEVVAPHPRDFSHELGATYVE